MNICLRPQPPVLSRSLTRVADALEATAPASVRLVRRAKDADLTIHHVLGRGQLDAMEQDIRAGKPFGAIQYCVKSSDVPDPLAWLRVWKQARLVTSYYDLWEMVREEILTPDGPARAGAQGFFSESIFPRYRHAPLGVDRTVFHLGQPQERRWLLATTGYVAETECLQECADAVAALGGRMLHLGHRMDLGPHVDYVMDIPDEDWANYLRQCQFVAGLRRIEGFELPILEGYACGAIPITFETPCYDWFQNFALRVPEGSPAYVSDAIRRTLDVHRGDAVPTKATIDAHLAPFDWTTITRGFWERLLS